MHTLLQFVGGLNLSTKNAKFDLQYHSFVLLNCYHLFNVINFGLAKSDNIKLRLQYLYFLKMTFTKDYYQ